MAATGLCNKIDVLELEVVEGTFRILDWSWTGDKMSTKCQFFSVNERLLLSENSKFLDSVYLNKSFCYIKNQNKAQKDCLQSGNDDATETLGL